MGVTLVEVSPRDGLQNESVHLLTAAFLTEQLGHEVPARLPTAGILP